MVSKLNPPMNATSGAPTEYAMFSSAAIALRRRPPAWIARYIAGGDPFGKAGSYAIQSAMAGWIRRIGGSHSGIMGLPLYETAQLLRQARVRF